MNNITDEKMSIPSNSAEIKIIIKRQQEGIVNTCMPINLKKDKNGQFPMYLKKNRT